MIPSSHIYKCIIFLLTCSCSVLYADDITIRQIPVAKELPSNTVNRVFQDSDGFIWLGTPDGFCRYDGYSMKSFRWETANAAFLSNRITGGFAEDTLNHSIWIGTETGVLILDKRTHTAVPLDTSLLEKSPVRQILHVDNAMWVCSDDGLYLYNTDKSLKKKYLESANSIHIDHNGTVRATAWVGGVYYLNKETDTFLPYPRIGAENNPIRIFQDNAGRFWICTWGDGLYRFHPDRQGTEMYEYVAILNDRKVDAGIFYGIEQDNATGRLWVLSYAGLTVSRYDSDRIIPEYEFASSVNNLTNLFSDIIKDRDGNLWLGTFDHGVMIVNPVRSSVTNLALQPIKNRTGYLPNIVRAFEDKENELWLWQDRVGMFLLNPATSAIKRIEIPEINVATAVCYHSETDEIWVAVDYVPHIYRLRKKNGKIALTGMINMRTVFGGNNSNRIVRFLHEDKNGAVWAATNHTLLLWKGNTWQIVNDSCGDITGITEDCYGDIWLSTADNGLWQIERNKDIVNAKHYNTATGQLPGNTISCISASVDEQLWLCVNEKQLYSYNIDSRQFVDYTPAANANNFPISSIVAADNGHIWISGNKYVIEFNPRSGASVQYDVRNDLAIHSLNKNSITTGRGGSVIFGGSEGLCIITPSPQLKMPREQVKTVITDLKINGSSVYQRGVNEKTGGQEKLILHSNETNLEINFSSLNYLKPGQTRYAYMLEGIDEQWNYTESGRNFAVYNKLRKGEYTFLVQSTGENRLWSDEITRLVIVKKPAFYETHWAYIVYAIIIGFILFAGIKFYSGRIKLRNELYIVQIEKEKSEELVQTKLRFFTNIGHEFRTPLTLIMTPLSTLIHQLTDGDLKQKLSSIYRNAEDMLGLINQLLDFRKMEMGGEKLKLTCNDFVQFAEYVYLAFKDVVANKSIQFTFESTIKQLFMGFDKSKVRKIINNLYSNALKFTTEDGYIATGIRLVQEHGREMVCLEVADSGCGIPDWEQQTIFERFYQSENNDPDKIGSGIGLHLVREYVKLHGGHITVSSKIGEGSVFSVFLPVDLQPSGDNADTPQTSAAALPTETETNRNKEQKTLLVVEDNAELRHFLAEQLGGKFQVLQAENGEQGADMALKKYPDLIVSDLMMPVLNGLDMCQRLKTDIQTSHIPIILLTAKVSDEAKIETYKAGADSYIAKPFNFEVLLTRIETLIEQQEERRKLFHKTIEITPSSITASSLDEELIKKALLAVEKNIDNSDYSGDELASELAISRRQLLRKFHSIIGLSPTEFIRSVRLKRAAQLLKDSQYNISEIADRVGFNNIRSFNQNFKDKFGVTPTQYRNN